MEWQCLEQKKEEKCFEAKSGCAVGLFETSFVIVIVIETLTGTAVVIEMTEVIEVTVMIGVIGVIEVSVVAVEASVVSLGKTNGQTRLVE